MGDKQASGNRAYGKPCTWWGAATASLQSSAARIQRPSLASVHGVVWFRTRLHDDQPSPRPRLAGLLGRPTACIGVASSVRQGQSALPATNDVPSRARIIHQSDPAMTKLVRLAQHQRNLATCASAKRMHGHAVLIAPAGAASPPATTPAVALRDLEPGPKESKMSGACTTKPGKQGQPILKKRGPGNEARFQHQKKRQRSSTHSGCCSFAAFFGAVFWPRKWGRVYRALHNPIPSPPYSEHSRKYEGQSPVSSQRRVRSDAAGPACCRPTMDTPRHAGHRAALAVRDLRHPCARGSFVLKSCCPANAKRTGGLRTFF